MVSDDEIVSRLGEILKAADLTVTTTSSIRKQLEKDLEVDLTEKKAFIRHHVDLYLQQHHEQMRQKIGEVEVKGEEEVHGNAEDEEQVGEEKVVEDGGEEEEEQGEEEADDNEEEQQDEVEPEPDSKRFKAKIERVKRESLQKEKKRRSGGGGLNKSLALSPELQVVLGVKEMPRPQVVKHLWVYIRERNLQDPDNRRKIVCDEALRAVMGSNTIDMFKMNKILSKHLWPLDDAVEEEPKVKKPKMEMKEQSEKEKGGKDKVKEVPKLRKSKMEKEEHLEKEKGGKGKGGLTAPLPLSDALTKFLGTGESQLSRADVVKRMWDYIKSNQLQDPSDKRQVLCDAKLRELFGCDRFHGFGISKHLAPHFVKK